MSLEELRQKNKEYRAGLVQTAHMFEDQKKEILGWLQTLNSNEVSLKLKGPVSASVIKSAFVETLEAHLFNISVIHPLRHVLSYYETKGRFNTDPNKTYEIKFDFDSNTHTSRSIFQLINQLPNYLVLEVLDFIYSENNDESLLDAFFQQNEDDFVKSFGQLKLDEKEYLKSTFIRIAQALSLQPIANEIYNKKYDEIDDLIYDTDILAPIVDEMLPETGILSIRAESLLHSGTPLATIQSMRIPYKKVLLHYLFRKALMDDFTKSVIEGIIQNPDYLDITNELLAECKEELKQESISKEKPDSVDDELSPLPFPYENVKLKEAQKESFLAELYELLLNANVNRDKPYIQTNKKELFVYLFGGFEAKPVPCTPIIWLRQKNELQAFLLALYGNNAGNDPGWAKFNNYFWWKTEGISPQLANNSGNISEDAIVKLNNLLKPLIVKYAPDQD